MRSGRRTGRCEIARAEPAVAGDGRLARGEEARRQILDAAVEVLAEDRIAGVSVAAVARRAGVSRALVHYHFETHAALLGAAIEATYRVARSGVTDVGGPRLDALAALAAKVEASLPIGSVSRLEWELWVDLWAGAVRDPELRSIAVGVYERLHAVLATIVERGVEEGLLHPGHVGSAVDRILALMDGYGVRVLLGDPAIVADEARRQVRRGLADALGIEPDRLPAA